MCIRDSDYANLKMVDELNVEEYGVAFRKGSDVAEAVDNAFDELKACLLYTSTGWRLMRARMKFMPSPSPAPCRAAATPPSAGWMCGWCCRASRTKSWCSG